MFRASSAHLQEDTVVYKQHMVPSLSIRVLVAWISFKFEISYSGSEVSVAHSEVRLWLLRQLVWPTLRTSAVDSPPNSHINPFTTCVRI